MSVCAAALALLNNLQPWGVPVLRGVQVGRDLRVSLLCEDRGGHPGQEFRLDIQNKFSPVRVVRLPREAGLCSCRAFTHFLDHRNPSILSSAPPSELC